MTDEGETYVVAWRPLAVEDLRAIVRYIGRDSLAMAQRLGEAIRAKTTPLARFPALGRPGRPGLPDGVRELIVHRSYIVFYRVVEEAHTVEILRVKHVAQRFP